MEMVVNCEPVLISAHHNDIVVTEQLNLALMFNRIDLAESVIRKDMQNFEVKPVPIIILMSVGEIIFFQNYFAPLTFGYTYP